MENNANGTNVINEDEIQWQINMANRGNSSIKVPTGLLTNTTNTTGTFTVGNMYQNRRIISVLVKEVTIEIAYRESPMYTFAIYGPGSTPPDRVWKEIYGLKDGRMTLLEVVAGKHQQAYHVEESFVFDDDPDVKSPNRAKEE